MNCQSIEDVKKVVEEKDISFIQFWFTDILGVLKSFAITPSELDEGLTEGMGFDGSSIEGFARKSRATARETMPLYPGRAAWHSGCQKSPCNPDRHSCQIRPDRRTRSE